MVRVAKVMRNRLNTKLNEYYRLGKSSDEMQQGAAFAIQTYTGLTKELTDAGYYRLVEKLGEKENDLLRLMKKSRLTGAVPLAFTKTTQAKLQAVNSLYNLNFARVGQDAMLKISGIMMDTISRSGRVDVAIKQIEAILDKNLVRYATTYANTTRAKFIQKVEDITAQEAREEGQELYWEFFGPTDDLNRPACIEGLDQQFFTDAEREQFEADTADEREWNCRHKFMEITEEYYREQTG